MATIDQIQIPNGATYDISTRLEKSATNSFDDGVDGYFKKVVSTIVPVQAGSGTPSPTNVRPITGFTECTVKDNGKNLFDISSLEQGVLDPDTGQKLPSSEVKISGWIKVNSSSTYFWNGQNFRFFFYKRNKTFISRSDIISNSTITTPSDCEYIRIQAANEAWNASYLQLEQGSTPTAYEPYTATTATISFGSAGTVYGGTVDLIRGKLVVDRVMEVIKGSEGSWDSFAVGTKSATARYQMSYISKRGETLASKIGAISSTGEELPRYWYTSRPNESLETDICFAIDTSYVRFYITDTTIADITAFKTAFVETTLVYPLETPVEYQLTPAQLRSLVGANRLTSSTGEVTEVEYITNKTITYVDDKVESLKTRVDLEKSATNSFDDGIDSYFKKVVSTIVPVQAGSGTPSPTNVRTISGFTKCVVKDFGNNFMPQKDVSVPDALTNIPIYFDLPKGTYTISAKVSTDGSDTDCRYNVRVGSNAIAVGFLDVSGGRASSTFTIDQDCDRIYFYGGHATSTQANTTYTDIQIERGSTPTAYTPYVTPTTATISFGTAGTVYSGYVDLISGKLVVDRAVITDVSTFAIDKNSASPTNYLYYMAVTGNISNFDISNPSLICSHAPTVATPPVDEIGMFYSNNYRVIYLNFGEISPNTVAGFKSFWSSNDIQLVYKLATPIEYQLTPAQLRSLVGANRLTSSTGEVTEVEYITNKTITYVDDKVEDLSNQINRITEPIECTCSLSNGTLTITLPSGYTWSQLKGHTLTAILAEYLDCCYGKYKIQALIPFHHNPSGLGSSSDEDYYFCSITGDPRYLYWVSDSASFLYFYESSPSCICQIHVSDICQYTPSSGSLDITDYTETTDKKWSAFIL